MIDMRKFAEPEAKYRIHPFWFWNGEMQNEQIELQISEMADKGVGGFFLCARQGMTLPYLSKTWFEKVRFAVETAKRCHLDVWLYDEYPYPSGIAGGEVILEHPDAKHHSLSHHTVNVSRGEKVTLDLPWGRILLAQAIPLDRETGEPLWYKAVDVSSDIGNSQIDPVYQKTGLTDYNQKRFFTYGTHHSLVWTAPERHWNEWTIHIFLEVEIKDFKYYGTFVDPGHNEAMATFIRLTHQRYKEEVGTYFGETIKGMFTDEIGYLGRYPWSPRLPGFFTMSNSYPLKQGLPALVDRRFPNAQQIRYDYFQSLHHLLRESYHKQVHDWCAENELDYVAEVPSMRMTTQLFSDVIGSDSAHEKLGRSLISVIDKNASNLRANPKMVSSLARQLGRDRALVECFHSVGWSMTLQDAKWMIDRMASMGVNFFNFHAFFYTLNGLAKHDAPPSQFLQNPYWVHFRQLGDYVGRISYIMSEGETVCRIAVLDPTTSFWTHLANPLHGFHYVGEDERESARLRDLKDDWVAVTRMLLLNHAEYDHLDPELLAEADIQEGTIRLGKAAYAVLIIPPMTNLEIAAWHKIKEFILQGGIVIGMGMLPFEQIEIDGLSQTEVLSTFELDHSPQYPDGTMNSLISGATKQLKKGNHNVYFVPKTTQGNMLSELMDLLNDIAPPMIRMGEEETLGSFLSQCRIIKGSYVIFLSNQEDKTWSLPVHITGITGDTQRKQWNVQVLDLETGVATRIPYSIEDGVLTVNLDFAPYQSHLIQCTLNSIDNLPALEETNESSTLYQVSLDASGAWEMRANNLNVVRFDEFELTLNPEEKGSSGVMVQAKTFIHQCSDISNHQNIPLSFRQVFGTPMGVGISYPIQCRYTAIFTVLDVPRLCEMVLDEGAIKGEFVIYVNGKPVTKEELVPLFLYDHMNRGTSILDFLQIGENRIDIDVVVSEDWGGVVDAIYLRGDFGVGLDKLGNALLTAQPEYGELSGCIQQSFPYYSGVFTMSRTFVIDRLPDQSEFELVFNHWDPDFHDCAEVVVNGTSLGVRAWTPYRWSGQTTCLNQGENKINVRVTNTLVGTIEGRYFDYQTHELKLIIDR